MSILSICFRGEIRKIFIWIFLFSGYAEWVMCRQIWANTADLLPTHDFVQLVDSGYFEVQGTL